MHTQNEVTLLLRRAQSGNEDALNKLIPLVYDELHALAERFMRRERSDHTLQTTALVHEAYLRLIDQKDVRWEDRAHFFAIASTMIRRILVDYARGHGAAKRGGDRRKVALQEDALVQEKACADLIALDDALKRLAAEDPRKCRVVEMRYFGDLTEREIAEVLGISTTTVERDWSMARAWLYREVSKGVPRGD